ncbi:MAG: lipase maturation factor family protein, partial [Polyangiaceae bacterium]|nr:lipase maturation factor family protein [Polyangiaceae bacterium]
IDRCRAGSSFDLRGIAVFRVLFGVLLLGYLATRVYDGNFAAFHTNDGVLPNYAVLSGVLPDNAWSLLNAASTPTQAGALFVVFGVAFACLAAGYHTRLAAVVSLVASISLYNRNVLVTNASLMFMLIGGYWTLFLPLGEVWSVDAWLRKRREGAREPGPMRRSSLAVWGFRFHMAAVYFLNCVHKDGPTWKSGQAVHLVLWQDRYTTPIGVWFRSWEPAWFSPAASWGTLLIEAALPLLLLSPIAGRQSRRVAAALIVFLHVGISVFVNLGPFPFVLPSLALLLLTSEDWSPFERRANALLGRLRARLQASPLVEHLRTRVGASESFTGSVPEPARSAEPFARPPIAQKVTGLARETLYAALIVLVAFKLWEDNAFPRRYLGDPPPRPELSAAAAFLGLPQSWKLFSPDAPQKDVRLVIDAVRADGSHVDPLTGEPPDFEAMRHGPWGMNYLWQTYQGHLAGYNNRSFGVYLMQYVDRIPELEGWDDRRPFESVSVWVLSGRRPEYGKPHPEPHRVLAARRGDASVGADAPPPLPSDVIEAADAPPPLPS